MSDYEKEFIAARTTKNSRNHFVVITGAKVWDEKNILPIVHIDYIIYYRFSIGNYRRKKRSSFTTTPHRTTKVHTSSEYAMLN